MLAVVALLFAWCSVAFADEPMRTFDAHVHYNDDSRVTLPPVAALARLDRAGVARALVSSTPNDGTLALHQLAPARVVPLLRPYRTASDRVTWYGDGTLVAFLERELARAPYRGIGEFHLRGDEARGAAIAPMLDLARQRRLLLHAHVDAAALDALYTRDPDARILWAHAGLEVDAAGVGARLDRHSTLWVELSLRDMDIAPGGTLDPDWRRLFERHPDRFLLGTDTWTAQRWDAMTEVHASARGWLAELPSPVARAIAYGNADRLFPATALSSKR